jgi:hypothetical protein
VVLINHASSLFLRTCSRKQEIDFVTESRVVKTLKISLIYSSQKAKIRFYFVKISYVFLALAIVKN